MGVHPRADASSLVDELKYLRKGEGLVPTRLAETIVLKRLVAPESDGAVGLLHLGVERVAACLRGMLDTVGGSALWAAFGLGVDADTGHPAAAGNLKERRAAFAALIGRSPYTVREHEDRALEELALRLLSGYFPSAAVPEVRLPHGGLLLARLDVTTHIQDLHYQHDRQVRRVISLVDAASEFVYGSYSPTILTDVNGATVTTEQHPGGTIHRLRFDPPLARGRHHEFAFTQTLPETDGPAGDPPSPDFAGQTFETSCLEYRQAVAFEGRQPGLVWAYDKLSRIERPGRPHTLLTAHGDADTGVFEVEQTFLDLYGGLASGVAWAS